MTVSGMTDEWPLHLMIDAAGSDEVRVRPRHVGMARPHVVVRTGPLVTYCVDGAAITSAAAAWALAHASSARLLPHAASLRRPPHDHVAAAASDIVLEGRQRWDVVAPRPGQPYTLVTCDSLTVRVHDLAALETHTRAWSIACALGARFLPTPPPAFGRLLDNARDIQVAREHHIAPPGQGRSR